MRLILCVNIALGLGAFFLPFNASGSETPMPDAAAPSRAPIEKIAEGKFRIGNAILEKTSATLRIPARVNMNKGMIELVACASGGKLHESIFLAHIEPYHLHLALLLMGLKPKGGVQFQGDATTPEGDRVVVFVEYQNTRRRVEDYIWDLQAKQPMERTEWVFAGSKFINGEYGAQLTRTLMTTYHDPYTIIDNPLPTGADDEVYEVNTRLVPPVGTTVTLVIQPARAVARQGGMK